MYQAKVDFPVMDYDTIFAEGCDLRCVLVFYIPHTDHHEILYVAKTTQPYKYIKKMLLGEIDDKPGARQQMCEALHNNHNIYVKAYICHDEEEINLLKTYCVNKLKPLYK